MTGTILKYFLFSTLLSTSRYTQILGLSFIFLSESSKKTKQDQNYPFFIKVIKNPTQTITTSKPIGACVFIEIDNLDMTKFLKLLKLDVCKLLTNHETLTQWK